MSFQNLDSWLRSRSDADEFSGVVLIHQGTEPVFSGAYGWASRRWPQRVAAGMRFDTASITKLFTAVAALRLVDDGRLDLDAPITDVVDLAGTTISNAVTVRHLLTHTSGIADDADEEAGEAYAALWVDRPSYSVTETRHFLPQFAHKAPNFPPGQGCRYCNVGYILVGLAIEASTGTSYRDFVREHVFRPAGMAASDFVDHRDPAPDVAEGWDPVLDDTGARTGWRRNIFSYPPIGSPADGALVTAADLVTFLRVVRAGGLLSTERTREFLTPQVLHHRRDDGVAVHYGFGLEFVFDSDGAVISYYKEGINAGASGIVCHYPAADLDLVVLANSERGAWEPLRRINLMITGDDRTTPGFV